MLCDLPNEVIAIIASFCQHADLCALSRSCKLLYSHASPALYRHIVLKNGPAEYVMSELSRFMLGNEDTERRPPEEPRRRELLRQTRSLDISLPWYEPDSRQTSRTIGVINDMVNLHHMSLIYVEEEEYMNGHDLPLPSVLAETLTTCTVGFKDWANWSIWKATCLFKHPSLRQLELHWAASAVNDAVVDVGCGSTRLESLALIDCLITPDDLYQVLRYPRALQYLTLATDFNDKDMYGDEQVNCADYFTAIQRASGKSLQGLRFDVTHWGNIIVPAPGMHELRDVLYLEVAPDHIQVDKQVLNFQMTIPDIDCPLEQLLPPNLEVLKITPAASDLPTLWSILDRKSEIVPHLRKIILTLHYRNRVMKKELIAALRGRDAYENDPELFELDEEDLEKIYPCARKRVLRAFRGCCERQGVELMLLHEDFKRKEVFEEGAGPSVWEIEDQVKQ